VRTAATIIIALMMEADHTSETSVYFDEAIQKEYSLP
jgi:hypothetical protein